ncbi:nucleotidyltransferase family protein [bacterium]|nr:nucleotidyltransferase family protein [bacterium]
METDEKKAGKLEQLSTPNWDGVIQQSIRHSITPLLYQRLETLGPSTNIPASVEQKLREIYIHSAARNMRLYHELSKVLRILQNDDIPVIVLKGAALAETVYQNIALRPMGDVDLLVKKEDLYRTETALLNLGYVFYKENNYHFKQHYEGEKRIAIEIHWNIDRPSSLFQIDIDGMWERARLAKIANVEVLVLSPEDLILHLCLHVSFHHEFKIGLRFLCDISETIQHYQDEIDWKKLQNTVNEYGIGKFIYCTLLLTKKMLGAEIPDNFLNDLKPDTFEPQILEVMQDYILETPSLDLPVALQQAQRKDGFPNKIVTLFRGVFPSVEKLREIYSLPPDSTKAYFYYFVRPFDLIQRKGKDMLQLVFGTQEGKLSLEREKNKVIIERWLSETGRNPSMVD